MGVLHTNVQNTRGFYMKSLLILFFPVLIIAQTTDYPDSIKIKPGKVIQCLITDINERDISFLHQGQPFTYLYQSVENIYLEDNGIIYSAEMGFLMDEDKLNEFVHSRKKPFEPITKTHYEDVIKGVEKDSGEQWSRWSFGVTYIPYYSGKIYHYSQDYNGLRIYALADNQITFEGQFSYAPLPHIRLTFDLSYHSAYERNEYGQHVRSDYNPPYDGGSESSTDLDIFDFTLGFKYYFTKFLEHKVSAFILAGAGKQIASYNEDYRSLSSTPQPDQSSDNIDEFTKQLNSPWHFNAGFGAEYSFNESLTLFSNIRFIYSAISGDYHSRTIQPGQSRTEERVYEKSDISTRIGLGLNFYF